MVTLKSEQTAVEFGHFESFTKVRLGSFNLTHLLDNFHMLNTSIEREKKAQKLPPSDQFKLD